MVVEAVYENMQLKKDIFGKLDSFCHPRTILATNTSTLSIDEIAQATQRPEKVIGMHFFSPAHMMKLVECVKGAATSPETIAAVAKVAKEMKKASKEVAKTVKAAAKDAKDADAAKKLEAATEKAAAAEASTLFLGATTTAGRTVAAALVAGVGAWREGGVGVGGVRGKG